MLRDQQTFGYTYVGGTTFGADRMGLISPELAPESAPELDGGSLATPFAICGLALFLVTGPKRERETV